MLLNFYQFSSIHSLLGPVLRTVFYYTHTVGTNIWYQSLGNSFGLVTYFNYSLRFSDEFTSEATQPHRKLKIIFKSDNNLQWRHQWFKWFHGKLSRYYWTCILINLKNIQGDLLVSLNSSSETSSSLSFATLIFNTSLSSPVWNQGLKLNSTNWFLNWSIHL